MYKVVHSLGDKVGNCVFIREVDPKIVSKIDNKRVRKRRKALFQCSCGKEFIAIIDKVKNGETSCGCLQQAKMRMLALKAITHGKKKHPLYMRWSHMIQRCENINVNVYKHYGGRGIKVCERWHDINNFINDMYPSYIEGLEIDRVDNNGNYCPENCRWSTRKEQCNNKRNTIYISYQRVTKNISTWSEITKIPEYVILKRFHNWKLEDILSIPYPCPKNYRHDKK